MPEYNHSAMVKVFFNGKWYAGQLVSRNPNGTCEVIITINGRNTYLTVNSSDVEEK